MDERCHENVTTSMCDEDAHFSMLEHSTVIPLRDKRVMACWLGCDGVEDSYRNTEGTYTFYRKLMCELSNRKETGFEEYLADYLPEFSKMGSGDDVFVSGIVDMDRIETFVPIFSLQVEEYELKEELERFNNKLISMSRKHGLLQKQAEEAENLYKQKETTFKTYQDAHTAFKTYQDAHTAFKTYQDAHTAFKSYDDDYKKIKEQIDKINGQLQECEKRRSLLGEEVKKKEELKKQMPKTETSSQRDFILNNGFETPKKPERREEMLNSIVARYAGIFNREVVNNEVGIILLIFVLLLALSLLVMSIWIM